MSIGKGVGGGRIFHVDRLVLKGSYFNWKNEGRGPHYFLLILKGGGRSGVAISIEKKGGGAGDLMWELSYSGKTFEKKRG